MSAELSGSGFDETQFSNGDRSNAMAFIAQQREFRALPEVRAGLREMRRMALGELILSKRSTYPVSLAEFGCGYGANLMGLGRHVVRLGLNMRMVGFDFNQKMLDEAASQSAEFIKGLSPIRKLDAPQFEFRKHDINLPVSEGSKTRRIYDVVLIDRVLAHNKGYESIVSNAAEVLKKGGLALFREAQWVEGEEGGGLTIASSLPRVNSEIVDFYASSHPGANAANDLPRLLREAGLSVPENSSDIVGRRVVRIENKNQAFRLAGILTMTQKAVDAGAITENQRQDWLSEQEKRTQEGRFLIRLPLISAYGWKDT